MISVKYQNDKVIIEVPVTAAVELRDAGRRIQVEKPAKHQGRVDGGTAWTAEKQDFPVCPWNNPFIKPGCYQARIERAQWESYTGGRRIRIDLVLDNGQRIATYLNYSSNGSPTRVDQRLGYLCKATEWSVEEVKQAPGRLADVELGVWVGDNNGYTDVLQFNPT